MLISFSGLDGAGKSTLIEGLKRALEKRGYRVIALRMYDHIVFYSFLRNLRDGMKKILGANKRNGVAPAPRDYSLVRPSANLRDPKIGVEDKNGFLLRCLYRIVRSQFMKRIVLFLDLISLVLRRFYEEKLRKRILIVDRYLYDFLADVADLRGKKWSFIKFFIRISPVPDLPVFVDVPAKRAFERKQEYPIAYMEWRRATYRKTFEGIKNVLILANDDLEETGRRLEAEALKRIAS